MLPTIARIIHTANYHASNLKAVAMLLALSLVPISNEADSYTAAVSEAKALVYGIQMLIILSVAYDFVGQLIRGDATLRQSGP